MLDEHMNDNDTGKSENKMREVTRFLLTLVGAVLFGLLFQLWIARPANISGNSMEPTLSHGDRVIVTRVPYWFRGPRVGDIIAFPYRQGEYFIKRITAIPGDVVDVSEHQFVVNGTPMDDEFSAELIFVQSDVDFPVIVPENSFFVLGDNRNVSKDSRFQDVGFIPFEQIIGKAVMQIWPLNALRIF